MEIIEIKIKDIIENSIEAFKKESYSNDTFFYIDISSVDNVSKKIIEAKELKTLDAPSRAKSILKTGDIILSNVRPNLNAVALITNEFDGSIGSSGFTVIRVKKEYSNELLFQVLTSPLFIDYVENLVQGAMYPAINDDDIKKFKVKLPKKLSDQIELANKLKQKINKVEELRKSAIKQLEAIQALPKRILKEELNLDGKK
jgi:type I restriction enzyme S subunit